MKTKAAAANKATVDEDEDEPKKIRSSRSKRRHMRSSTESESPPRKRSKKPSKRTADKKSKRSKVSSSRRRRRSPSPSPSLSSGSSPSSVSRSCSTCSSSSERSVSPPPRSQSRDVKKRKGRGRDWERDLRRRKARRLTSSSCTSSSGGSRSRSKSSKRSTKDGTTREIGKDYENVADYFDRDEEAFVAKKGCNEIERYEKKNVSLEKIENPPAKNANETEDIVPAGGGSPVAEDLELILRQRALDNFRKFRAAAAMAGKTDNGATRKETLTDSAQNAGTEVSEARFAAITPFARQSSSFVARHPTESPKPEDCGSGKSPWMQKSSAGTSHRAGSPSRLLKDGDTGGSTLQEGSTIEATHSTSQPRSPQDVRNSRSVMQRLVNTPGSSSVKQRLGSSAGVSHVNVASRIKSVVSVPAREGRDGSTTLQRSCENSAPLESSSEIRHTPIDINKAEGTNGDDRKTNEASASNGSILSFDEGKRQDKDGSQFQKKTFSRMHDGETVEVSYKVYIPKKTPALARRKLQR